MYSKFTTQTFFQSLLLAAAVGCVFSGTVCGQMQNDTEQKTFNSSKDWTRWGGPNGDFTVDNVTLANKWPKSGPPLLWSRELGEGYSSVSVSDGCLFTIYREEEAEVVVCLDAKNGKTKWLHRYPSPFTRAMKQYGPGPHSTPLVSEKLVHTIGINLVVHALEKKSGKVVWKKDLAKELGAKVPFRGHASSPISYGDKLILAAGIPGKQQKSESNENTKMVSLLALRKSDGKLMWTGLEGEVAYSTPVLTEIAGTKQIVLFMRKSVAAVNPENGKELWRVPVIEGHNVATPIIRDEKIFVTAAFESGGKLIELSKKTAGKEIAAVEKWKSRWMRFDQGNAIWIDNFLCATTGDSGPAFFVCLDAQTGKQVWRKRGYRRATLIYADKKLIMLQEDGKLQLIQFSDEEPTVLAEHKIKLAKKPAWTPPTLVGTTLYVRTRTHLMAFNLGKKTLTKK